MRKLVYLNLVLLAAACWFANFNVAQASWGYYRSVTATTSATAIPASQSNFPALIDVTLTSLETTSSNASGRVQNVNGYDIVPFSDNACTSQIPFEREKYVSSTGELEMWVKQSTLNTSTVDYLCYGNSAQTTDLSSSSAPWDSNFGGVWHLADAGTSTSTDSTANQNNGSNSSIAATSAIIDGGANMNGGTVHVARTSSLSPTSAVTLSAWVYPYTTSQSAYAAIASMEYNYPHSLPYQSYSLNANFAGSTDFYWYDTSGGSIISYSGSYNPNTWYDLVATNNNGVASFYINDSLVATTTAANPIVYNNGDFWLGSTGSGGDFNGAIDEVRISNVARSSSWIATDYWNNIATGTAGFWSVGNETAISGGAAAYPIGYQLASGYFRFGSGYFHF